MCVCEHICRSFWLQQYIFVSSSHLIWGVFQYCEVSFTDSESWLWQITLSVYLLYLPGHFGVPTAVFCWCCQQHCHMSLQYLCSRLWGRLYADLLLEAILMLPLKFWTQPSSPCRMPKKLQDWPSVQGPCGRWRLKDSCKPCYSEMNRTVIDSCKIPHHHCQRSLA